MLSHTLALGRVPIWKPLSNFYNFVEFLTFPFALHTLNISGVVAHFYEDK